MYEKQFCNKLILFCQFHLNLIVFQIFNLQKPNTAKFFQAYFKISIWIFCFYKMTSIILEFKDKGSDFTKTNSLDKSLYNFYG